MIDEQEEDWPLIYSGYQGIEWTEEQKEEFIKQLKYVAAYEEKEKEMTELHKMATEEDYKRMIWVYHAVTYLKLKYAFDLKDGFELAEVLYEGYVLEDDHDCSPEHAVDEEMTYWGD